MTTARLIIALLILAGAAALAQEAAVPPDTTRVAAADSLAADSARAAREESGVDTLVNYSGDDIDFDVVNRITILSGNAVITYKDMRLEAGRIEVDWDAQVLTASPLPDTTFLDSARTEIDSIYSVGRPHFVQATEDFFGDEIAYNMKTRIGRVRGGSTTYEDGIYYGKQFKRVADDVVTVRSGSFTTCPSDTPHYHFWARDLKVTVGKRVIARPVVICFDDVPVLAAPYGVFPQQRGRTSGILVPTFGESASQGRFLRDLGYYWVISDYMDARTSIDYYEMFGILGRGGWRYNKRYVLNGNADFDFNTQRQGDLHRRDFSVSAVHNHTIDRNTRLAVSGRYVSSNSYNSSVGSVQDQLNQSVQSNATLGKSWDNSPWTMSVNTGYTQNIRTSTWSATLPAASFTHKTGQLFPPRKAPRGVRGAVAPREASPPWYRTFTWSYSAVYRDELELPHRRKEEGLRLSPPTVAGRDVTATQITGDDTTSISQRDGITHTASLSASARLLKYFNLNPRISLRSLTTRRAVAYVAADSALDREDELGAFQRTTFDLGGNLTTKLYGLMQRPLGVQASFRHVMTPSVGFTYRPDFSKKSWDYYRTVTLPDGLSYTYDRFPASENISGAGGTPKGLSESMNFSVEHLLQMKTGSDDEEDQKKFDLLTWTMNTAVDFRRDSLKWNDLSMSWRTGVPGRILGPLQGLNFDISTQHSFYESVGTTRVDRFFWERDGGQWYAPLDLMNASANVGFTLQAQTLGDLVGIRSAKRPVEPEDTVAADTTLPLNLAEVPDVRNLPAPTASTSREPSLLYQMPLSIAVNLRQSRDYTRKPTTKTSNMGARATFSLTPRWDISFDYAFDLDRREVRNTSVQVTRDLHCWEASFSWSPLGYRPGYYLRIGLKSPQLRDVKVERHRGAGFGGYF